MARKTTKKAKTSTAIPSETAIDEGADELKSETSEAPVVLDPPEVVMTLAKKELIERVVESSGIKKKFAKPVIEAMLRELGEALSRGETLNLQPLGKGIIKSRKSLENADVIELRLRRSKIAMAAADAALEDSMGDDSTASGDDAIDGASDDAVMPEAAE